jgi:hypothetical protein
MYAVSVDKMPQVSWLHEKSYSTASIFKTSTLRISTQCLPFSHNPQYFLTTHKFITEIPLPPPFTQLISSLKKVFYIEEETDSVDLFKRTAYFGQAFVVV